MGLQDELKILGDSVNQAAQDWDQGRQSWIDASSQKVDDVVTGGLERFNVPGAEFIGDRSRNITGFAQDVLLPESWELPILAGGATAAAVEPTLFGEAAVGLKYGQGVSSRAYRLGKRVLEKPLVQTAAHMANVVDDAFSKANSLFSRATNPNWRLATDGPSIDTSMLMSKSDDLQGRMDNAGKNLPPEAKGTPPPSVASSKAARVTKKKIRNHADQFGGASQEEINNIYQEQVLKASNEKQSRTWLNKYFKKLTSGLGPDGLKDVNIADIDGVPTLVDSSTGLPYKHAFEVDHTKAKTVFNELGIEGADFYENLNTVYTVFNRAKNNLGNPSIPDEISRAVGRSTSLKEFVQRRISETFNKEFTHVPPEFRQAAETRMLDNVQNSIPIKGKKTKLLNRIVEEEKALWDWIGPIMQEAANTAPKEIQDQLDDFVQSTNPIEEYENVKRLIDEMGLSPELVKRYKDKAAKWLKFMTDRSKRGGTPGGPDLSPGMFPDD